MRGYKLSNQNCLAKTYLVNSRVCLHCRWFLQASKLCHWPEFNYNIIIIWISVCFNIKPSSTYSGHTNFNLGIDRRTCTLVSVWCSQFARLVSHSSLIIYTSFGTNKTRLPQSATVRSINNSLSTADRWSAMQYLLISIPLKIDLN